MMARKLAGLLAMFGLMALLGGWLVQSFWGSDAMSVDTTINYGICILVIYFVFGVFVAKLAINLVQEVIEERHDREEERRAQARMRYQGAGEDEDASDDTANSGPGGKDEADAQVNPEQAQTA